MFCFIYLEDHEMMNSIMPTKDFLVIHNYSWYDTTVETISRYATPIPLFLKIVQSTLAYLTNPLPTSLALPKSVRKLSPLPPTVNFRRQYVFRIGLNRHKFDTVLRYCFWDQFWWPGYINIMLLPHFLFFSCSNHSKEDFRDLKWKNYHIKIGP